MYPFENESYLSLLDIPEEQRTVEQWYALAQCVKEGKNGAEANEMRYRMILERYEELTGESLEEQVEQQTDAGAEQQAADDFEERFRQAKRMYVEELQNCANETLRQLERSPQTAQVDPVVCLAAADRLFGFQKDEEAVDLLERTSRACATINMDSRVIQRISSMLGQHYEKKGDLLKARESYEKACEAGSTEAVQWLYQYYTEKENKPENARKYLIKLLENASDEERYCKAVEFLEAGNRYEAAKWFGRVAQSAGSSEDLRCRSKVMYYTCDRRLLSDDREAIRYGWRCYHCPEIKKAILPLLPNRPDESMDGLSVSCKQVSEIVQCKKLSTPEQMAWYRVALACGDDDAGEELTELTFSLAKDCWQKRRSGGAIDESTRSELLRALQEVVQRCGAESDAAKRSEFYACYFEKQALSGTELLNYGLNCANDATVREIALSMLPRTPDASVDGLRVTRQLAELVIQEKNLNLLEQIAWYQAACDSGDFTGNLGLSDRVEQLAREGLSHSAFLSTCSEDDIRQRLDALCCDENVSPEYRNLFDAVAGYFGCESISRSDALKAALSLWDATDKQLYMDLTLALLPDTPDIANLPISAEKACKIAQVKAESPLEQIAWYRLAYERGDAQSGAVYRDLTLNAARQFVRELRAGKSETFVSFDVIAALLDALMQDSEAKTQESHEAAVYAVFYLGNRTIPEEEALECAWAEEKENPLIREILLECYADSLAEQDLSHLSVPRIAYLMEQPNTSIDNLSDWLSAAQKLEGDRSELLKSCYRRGITFLQGAPDPQSEEAALRLLSQVAADSCCSEEIRKNCAFVCCIKGYGAQPVPVRETLEYGWLHYDELPELRAAFLDYWRQQRPEEGVSYPLTLDKVQVMVSGGGIELLSAYPWFKASDGFRDGAQRGQMAHLLYQTALNCLNNSQNDRAVQYLRLIDTEGLGDAELREKLRFLLFCLGDSSISRSEALELGWAHVKSPEIPECLCALYPDAPVKSEEISSLKKRQCLLIAQYRSGAQRSAWLALGTSDGPVFDRSDKDQQGQKKSKNKNASLFLMIGGGLIFLGMLFGFLPFAIRSLFGIIGLYLILLPTPWRRNMPEPPEPIKKLLDDDSDD